MTETKRKYERLPEKSHRGRTRPPIIYDENGKAVDRREYDKWYSASRRDYSTESQEDKNKRYERYSHDYWVKYCTENELDPKTWKEVKKRVEHEKFLEKQRRRYQRW